MGLFSKDRHGTIKATDGSGRRFAWTIPNFGDVKFGETLDSANVACYTKVKFHFHMTIGNTGDIGMYIHYKKPPIPKYSYYFENARGHVMRQHTAHTIPDGTERCGHWNVCNFSEMNDFLGLDDTLTVRIIIDDDNLVVKKVPDQNLTSILWTIPNVMEQNPNPYSSLGFTIDNTVLVGRMDTKRVEGEKALTLDPANIDKFVFFLFCRSGSIPAHSIELVDHSGEAFAKEEKGAAGAGTTLIIPKDELTSHIGADGALFVRFNLEVGGNPLDALNLGGPLTAGGGADTTPGANTAPPGSAAEAAHTAKKAEVGGAGEKKEVYDVMDD